MNMKNNINRFFIMISIMFLVCSCSIIDEERLNDDSDDLPFNNPSEQELNRGPSF